MGATRRAEKKKMRLLRRELKEQARAVTARLLGTTVTPKCGLGQQRKRHKEEVELGIKPDIRSVFLTAKMKAKREAKRRKVTQRLLGKR